MGTTRSVAPPTHSWFSVTLRAVFAQWLALSGPRLDCAACSETLPAFGTEGATNGAQREFRFTARTASSAKRQKRRLGVLRVFHHDVQVHDMSRASVSAPTASIGIKDRASDDGLKAASPDALAR